MIERDCGSCKYREDPDESTACASCFGALSNWVQRNESDPFDAGVNGGGDIYAPDDKAEQDPAGLTLSTPGAKADANKPRVDLIFDGMPLALLEVARVATFGAAKYSEHGWLKVPNGFQRYTAAMDRHRLQEGEFIDRDSGLAHAAHCAWNALARLELLMQEGARK